MDSGAVRQPVFLDIDGVLADVAPTEGAAPVKVIIDGGTLVTSFYDWSNIHQHWRDANIFPIVSELALRGTLGILDRTVRRGYPKASTKG